MGDAEGRDGVREDPARHLEGTEHLDVPVMVIHRNRRVLAANDIAQREGILPGTICWDTFGKLESIPSKDREYYCETGEPPHAHVRCTFCRADRALISGEEHVLNIPVGPDMYETHWRPVEPDVYVHWAVKAG